VLARQLTPEWLDRLPSDDPAARRSRRDLRRINAAMGNFSWLEGELRQIAARNGKRPLRAVELGAGDGGFGQRLERRWPGGCRIDALDLAPRPESWPAGWSWEQVDLLQFDRFGEYDAVVANLTLHHFADAELAALGERLRAWPPRVLLVSEPLRRRRFQTLMRLLAPLLHPVTRHDAHVSIAAGFRGNELPRLLGMNLPGWRARWTETRLGAWRMVAQCV
jgi:hypothetical protein